jgi:hypothetical protein
VNRPALEGVLLPPVTQTYQPIGHNVLLDMVEDQMADIGFRFGSEHHGLSHDGARYFGVVELLGGQVHDEFTMLMGIRNSLDKKFGAGVAFGQQVMVCANLCFFGEKQFGRKHTPNILKDLPFMIADAVSGTKALQDQQVHRIEQYQGARIDQRDSDHMIINMLRRKVISASGIGKVMKEWDTPTHDFGDRTVWRMHNAVTETLKGTHMQEMPARTIALQHLCDEVAGFNALPLAA